MAGLLMKRAIIARTRARFHRGDPGFLGGLVKGIGKIASKALPIAKVIPGVGNVLSAVSLGSAAVGAVKGAQKLLGPGKAVMALPTAAAGGLRIPNIGGLVKGGALVAGGAAGASVLDRITGGAVGRRRYRRMNPLNPKAANRAIRRIKAVRKLCRTIESSLPKQKASCATRRVGKR